MGTNKSKRNATYDTNKTELPQKNCLEKDSRKNAGILNKFTLGEEGLILVLFVCLSICVCLVLSVSSSSWCLGRAAVFDCGTPWTFLLPFFSLARNLAFIL